MKKIKKILKWTGLVLLVIVVAVTVVTASRQHMKYDAPYPRVQASADSIVMLRGKQLAYGPAHCIDCHSAANADSLLALGLDVPLTGGILFDLPVGKIYSRNITPDKETGIGKYTDTEIARALRYGVHPDGTVVYDFMPFHNLSDEDLEAIISFLRSQKPVKQQPPANELNVLGNIVKAYMIKPVGPNGEVLKSVKKDSTVEYGRYLAMNVANCNGCHTKRDMAGAYTGEPLAGGNPMEAKPGFTPLVPPNITPDSSSRIFGWTEQDFIRRFRMGKVIPQSQMPWNSYKRMSDTELTAIYKFLRTVKPVKNKSEQMIAKK
jgi:mono/diheme cytochrome c family protein